LPAVEALRGLGYDILTTYESGNAGIALPDEQVLAFATAEQRILLTLNRKHFIRLHELDPNHVGIVVCTLDLDYAALAERIHAALEANEPCAGLLIRVNCPA
jgi:hypothetical protein